MTSHGLPVSVSPGFSVRGMERVEFEKHSAREGGIFLGALRGVGEGIPNFVVVDGGGKEHGMFF